jgi:hypothetical protein
VSQLLQVAGRSGTISGISTGSITHHNGGIPYVASGAVAIAIDGTIAHYHQGLPFDANGRLVVNYVNPVDNVGSGAAPFTADSKLNVVGGTVTHWNGGVPYVTTGHVRMSVLG